MIPMTAYSTASRISILAALLLASFTARADLDADLTALNSKAQTLLNQLTTTQLSVENLCDPLLTLNRQAREVANSAIQIDESLAAPLQIDNTTIDVLDDLSTTSVGLANEALRLSVDLQSLSTTANALTLKDGIVAMLHLSDDIGSMADRIGEMADKILVMSDDIGLMADRILLTQSLQNQNIALTTQSILQTQSNALTLVAVIEDSSYELNLKSLTAEGNLLAARMSSVVLNPFTMRSRLASVADDVNAYLDTVNVTAALIDSDTQSNTLYTTPETLIELGNLALMLTSLATAVDGYVIAIGGLQAFTSDPTLYASLKSMLALSSDIGIMANCILEMADQILIMADNIGLQADQIFLTQQAMNVNVATTQEAILGAQQLAINLIAARSL